MIQHVTATSLVKETSSSEQRAVSLVHNISLISILTVGIVLTEIMKYIHVCNTAIISQKNVRNYICKTCFIITLKIYYNIVNESRFVYPGAIIESHLSGSISLELPIIVIRIYMLLMVNLHEVDINHV